jgi:hypothetical protein
MSEKVELAAVLAAIDLGETQFYRTLTDQQKKGVTFFTMNRYISWVDNDEEHMATAVLATNRYFNKHFFTLSNHPELLWQLACMTGNPEKEILNHRWVGLNKTTDSKLMTFLSKEFPDYSDRELELLVKKNSEDDILNFLYELGLSDSAAKKLYGSKKH